MLAARSIIRVSATPSSCTTTRRSDIALLRRSSHRATTGLSPRSAILWSVVCGRRQIVRRPETPGLRPEFTHHEIADDQTSPIEIPVIAQSGTGPRRAGRAGFVGRLTASRPYRPRARKLRQSGRRRWRRCWGSRRSRVAFSSKRPPDEGGLFVTADDKSGSGYRCGGD
jgi:hypothetical protein